MEKVTSFFLPALGLNQPSGVYDALDWQVGPRNINQNYESISSITCCGTCSQTDGASLGAPD